MLPADIAAFKTLQTTLSNLAQQQAQAQQQTQAQQAIAAAAAAGIDGVWTAPTGWKMSIRNTAGGKNGQEDWGRTDGAGGFGNSVIYNNDGSWTPQSHGVPFKIISDGRLAAVNNNWGTGNDVKFSKKSA